MSFLRVTQTLPITPIDMPSLTTVILSKDKAFKYKNDIKTDGSTLPLLPFTNRHRCSSQLHLTSFFQQTSHTLRDKKGTVSSTTDVDSDNPSTVLDSSENSCTCSPTLSFARFLLLRCDDWEK